MTPFSNNHGKGIWERKDAGKYIFLGTLTNADIRDIVNDAVLLDEYSNQSEPLVY